MKTLHLSIIVILLSCVVILDAHAWCVGCISAEQQRTNVILIPSGAAAAVIVVWVFIFHHFKDK